MASEGFEMDRKREREDSDDGDDEAAKSKKQKTNGGGDDWMDDGDLFLKVVKTKSQEGASVSSNADTKDTESQHKAKVSEPNGVVEVNDKADNGNDIEMLDESKTKDSDSGACSKPSLQKIDSIQEDAQTIADLLELRNLAAIRARLRKVRKNPDRIEVVTNQLLEENEDDVCEIVDVKDGGKDGCEIVDVVEASGTSSSAQNKKSKAKEDDDEDDDVMQTMLKDIKEVCAKLKRKNPKAKFDTNTAYLLLESNLNKKNRVDIVVKEMLSTDSQEPSPSLEKTQSESITVDDKDSKTSSETVPDKETKEEPSPNEGTSDSNKEAPDILGEVETIMKKFPKADANRVFALLECRENDKNRVKAVVDILKEQFSNDKEEKTDNCKPGAVKRVLSESAVADDPLYKDMLQIAKIFPHIDKNEIYALCEVHHDKSKRIELVTEELLKVKRGEDDNDESQSTSPKKR